MPSTSKNNFVSQNSTTTKESTTTSYKLTVKPVSELLGGKEDNIENSIVSGTKTLPPMATPPKNIVKKVVKPVEVKPIAPSPAQLAANKKQLTPIN